jgi:hypothetical protein
MDLRVDASELRFSAYVEGLVSVIGHSDRAKPLRDYCMGLMLPCERKSVEPMAAVTAPERTAAQHQSLLHFIGEGRWSDWKVLAKVREMVLPEIERHGPIQAWIIDDTGFPKQGRHSVGVPGSTAANSASRTIVRSRCRYRLPITMPVCRWLIVCTCQKPGNKTPNAGARRACHARLRSRQNQRSHLSKYARRVKPAFLAGLC